MAEARGLYIWCMAGPAVSPRPWLPPRVHRYCGELRRQQQRGGEAACGRGAGRALDGYSTDGGLQRGEGAVLRRLR